MSIVSLYIIFSVIINILFAIIVSKFVKQRKRALEKIDDLQDEVIKTLVKCFDAEKRLKSQEGQSSLLSTIKKNKKSILLMSLPQSDWETWLGQHVTQQWFAKIMELQDEFAQDLSSGGALVYDNAEATQSHVAFANGYIEGLNDAMTKIVVVEPEEEIEE